MVFRVYQIYKRKALYQLHQIKLRKRRIANKSKKDEIQSELYLVFCIYTMGKLD